MTVSLFEQVGQLAANNPVYARRTGNDEAYKRFLELYPPTELKSLTLDQYCLGKGAQEGNFCWWLERGLRPVFGTYSPGTSRGHLIYKKKDGEIYTPKRLGDYSPSQALEHFLAIHHLFASTGSWDEALTLDGRSYVTDKLHLDRPCSIGEGRKLRLLTAYHPDLFLSISSSTHLQHFLELFGLEEQDIADKAIGRMHQLWKIYQQVKEEYYSELTPYGFTRALYSSELNIRPSKTGYVASGDVVETMDEEEVGQVLPRNLILYGPPGTGKTFHTINRALQTLDPAFYLEHQKDRGALRNKFESLKKSGRAGFVTFHQSFSYEDFVEGIKAQAGEGGEITYEVEDGIFKRMCAAASARVTRDSDAGIQLNGRKIWKMSLGNTLGDDAHIYDECISNNNILLGWGDDIDFTGCTSRNDVLEKQKEHGWNVKSRDYSVQSVYRFIHHIKVGDIVIISDGNHKFRAIAEITGDYRYLPKDDRVGYQQCRDVRWLRQYSPSLPREELFEKALSQQTLYQLDRGNIRMDSLQEMLTPQTDEPGSKSHVLIIDEINRGNISRIFGELITLVEPSKRQGASEALSVRLPYSKDEFSVPDNLYLIATMNTADRSLALMDTALRRRFVFEEMMPQPSLLGDISEKDLDGVNLRLMLETLNQRITLLYDREHTLGHSFFMPLKQEPGLSLLSQIFDQQVLPLLEEYFFEDWDKIRRVLGDFQKPAEFQFIHQKEHVLRDILGSDWEGANETVSYERNEDALSSAEAYIGIYKNLLPE